MVRALEGGEEGARDGATATLPALFCLPGFTSLAS